MGKDMMKMPSYKRVKTISPKLAKMLADYYKRDQSINARRMLNAVFYQPRKHKAQYEAGRRDVQKAEGELSKLGDAIRDLLTPGWKVTAEARRVARLKNIGK